MSADPAAPLPGPTPLGERPVFEGGLRSVADGVFAWLQPNGGLGESNAGLVVGDRESLLVDTLWDERLTARMLDAIAVALPDAPIRTLVNTHGDGDHWYGNGLLGDAEIVATDAAAEQMRAEPPAMLRRTAPLARIAGALAAVPLLPGRGRLRGLARFGTDLGAYELAGLEPRPPTWTFSGSIELDAGGRSVEVIEVGPAHTPGDAILHLGDAGVVFSGDLVFSGVTPIMWSGPVGNWIAGLDRIESLGPSTIVPGHGPVCGLERLGELRDYWRWLEQRVRAAEGRDAGGLASELVRSAEYRNAPWGGWRNPERTLINAELIAREVRGGVAGPIGLPKRIALLAAMGELRERLGG